MVEAILTKRNAGVKTKITVKSLISAALIALAVILPQIVHAALGVSGGVQWLPMYLPVLIGGCLLGWKWGLSVGVLSPIISFLVTLSFGNPMPVAVRLPYMVAELAVFATVTGLFSKSISENSWMAFPAVLLAAVAGRLTFLTVAAIFQTVSPISASMVWEQIQTGLSGLLLQAVIAPAIIMVLSFIVSRDNAKQ